MFKGYEKLAIPLPMHNGQGEAWLLIAPVAGRFNFSIKDCETDLADAWRGKVADDSSASPAILVNADDSRIRLLETMPYRWEIVSEEKLNVRVKCPELKDRRSQRWSVDGDDERDKGGRFCVINHLGFSRFGLLGEGDEVLLELRFEFVSKKLDFDSEYRRMTEDIAEFCEQLLLSWDTPTSLTFGADPENQHRLLLEQFFFLRHFLTDERVGRLLEAIGRNPHSTLVKEYEWKPVGVGRSSDYLSDPRRMLRAWHRGAGNPMAGEMLDVRKEDTHDTPPNRFVKFALISFRRLCGEVVELMGKKDGDSTAAIEAQGLMNQLDALLARRFFRDIGMMRRLPLDNQTLQKREGYREVLRAWILTEAAATLSWEGNEDCYDGSTRDVATLYEYWIFLMLHQVLEQILGLERVKESPLEGIEEFISDIDGQISIQLKRGKHSCSQFLWTDKSGKMLRVHLHYERTFTGGAGATDSGSYSRRFRPDYTLTIFPEGYATERKAADAGQVAHLHFDAKYRAEKIGQLFGDQNDVEDEGGEVLAEEKSEAKVLSTYKRGDLLKMHTYNDALRYTIGSYVLYPGSEEEPEKIAKFHEIAPGVGALVMKPGNEKCLEALQGFIEDVLEHQVDRFTQYRYLSDASYQTVVDKPGTVGEVASGYRVARRNSSCVLLWLRKEKADVFREQGFAYCHAVPEKDEDSSKALDLNLSIEIGSEFIPVGAARGELIHGHGWRAKVKSARFLSREKLNVFLQAKLPGTQASTVEHYVLFEFDEVTEFEPLVLDEVHKKHRSGSKFMAVSCRWSEIIEANEGSWCK